MNIRKALTGVALAVAGVAASVTLAFPPSAAAWDLNQLPSGYFVSSYTTVCHVATDPCVGGEGSTCNHVTITSSARTFAETDCVNPNFQQHLDAYIDSTICTVNPAAGGSACAPTTTAQTATAVTTATPATTTTDAPAATTAATTTTAPAQTVTVTTTVVDPTINDRLTALEQRQSADDARLAALESSSGLIIGEPKNVAPFTSAA